VVDLCCGDDGNLDTITLESLLNNIIHLIPVSWLRNIPYDGVNYLSNLIMLVLLHRSYIEICC